MRKLITLAVASLCAAMAFAEGEPVITAWRNSINTNDVTDFASIYVSDLGSTITGDAGYATGTVTYLWKKYVNDSWETYADGKDATTNNIRPIYPAKYRCDITLTYSDKVTTVNVSSNEINVSGTAGSSGPTISSNIPIIVIRTDAQGMPTGTGSFSSVNDMFERKLKRSADCKIIWNGKIADGSSSIYDGTMFDAHNGKLYYDKKIRISYRGSSSLTKNIRNYAFVCGDDNCGTNGKWVKGKERMFKLSDKKDKDWILYGANDDQSTFARNTLQLNLYEEMTGNWNSHCRYVQLYVDGAYKGIYIFMEKNKQSEKRIDVDEESGVIFKFDKTDCVDRYEGATTATTSEGAVEQNKCTFITSNAGKLNITTYGIQVDHAYEVVYPEYGDFTTDEWAAKITSIKNKIGAFETAVKNQNYTTLRTLIDYESFADYFIIQELAKNVDGYRISQYFKYKNADAKIKAEPLWDTELGLNNSSASGAKGSSSTSNLIVNDSGMYTDPFAIPFWWTGNGSGSAGSKGLMADACFKAKIKQRWAQHTAAGGPLTVSNISSKLSTYGISTSKTSSEITNWIGDGTSTGRLYRLGQIINGWSTTDYVNTVSAAFQNEPGVSEKQISVDGSVTMVGSATASSGGATLYYSWQRSDDGETNWVTVVDDEESAEHTFTELQESGYYRCRAKSSECDCIKYSSDNVLHVTVSQVKVTCK